MAACIRWSDGNAADRVLLAAWPIHRRPNWIDFVNTPLTDRELATLQHCVQRGTPYGDETWKSKTVCRLGLETTLRPRGRPKADDKGS